MKRLVFLLSVVAIVTGSVLAAPAASATGSTTYYVSPNGSGSACTSASPCSVSEASSDAQNGDVIAMTGTADTPYTSGLVISHAVTVEPAAGASPVLDPDWCGCYIAAIYAQGAGATITGLTIDLTDDDYSTTEGILVQAATTIDDDVFVGGKYTSAPAIDLDADGTMSVANSTIDTQLGFDTASGTATITDSTFNGGANFGNGTYGLNNEDATVDLSDSTITGYDSGVETPTNSTTVEDSTITGNADGIDFDADSSGVTLEQSTVAANSAFGVNAGAYSGRVTAAADIVADNTSGDCSPGVSATDDGNDLGSDGTCEFTAESSSSDAAFVIDYLGGLSDNGGPTQTMALLATPNPSTLSRDPAAGTVSGSFKLPDGSTACTVPDQRGVPRPSPCDVGAYELDSAPTVTTSSLSSGHVGQPYQASVTATGQPMPATSVTGLPSGLAFDSATGLITGTPAAPGDSSVQVSASNGESPDAGVTLTLSVQPRVDPTITAKLTSSAAKSHGWWRKPVTVTFSCHVGSAPLTATCPTAVQLKNNGRDQQVRRTIGATDGGTATVTVAGIDIDRTPPTIKVTGARNGHTYRSKRTLRCHAKDSLSGVASCKIVTKTKHSGATRIVNYVATAKDRAGNVAHVKGRYRIS